MNRKLVVLLLITLSNILIFSEGEKSVFIEKIYVESTTYDALESTRLYGDVNFFREEFEKYLKESFGNIVNLDNVYKSAVDKETALYIITSKVALESGYLKFTITKTDKDGIQTEGDQNFIIDPESGIDPKVSIEYSCKSALNELFGIYWLTLVRNDKSTKSKTKLNEIYKQLNQEITKTKRALIFDEKKDLELAKQKLSADETISDGEAIDVLKPYLYTLTIELEDIDFNTDVNLFLSKEGNVFGNPSKVVVMQDEYDTAFNDGKTIEKITDVAFEIMNVYNAEYFNEKISEIKNLATIKGDFKTAKKRLDDLEKKYIKKTEYHEIIKEYSDYLIDSDRKMIEVKKKHPLAIFPAVCGGTFLASTATAGVFTYLYFYNRDLSVTNYDLYNTSTTKGDAANYRSLYLSNINNMNLYMGLFIAFYSLGGVSLITGIIGLSVQLATIYTARGRLMNDGKKLKFYQKVGIILDYDLEERFKVVFAIKL